MKQQKRSTGCKIRTVLKMKAFGGIEAVVISSSKQKVTRHSHELMQLLQLMQLARTCTTECKTRRKTNTAKDCKTPQIETSRVCWSLFSWQFQTNPSCYSLCRVIQNDSKQTLNLSDFDLCVRQEDWKTEPSVLPYVLRVGEHLPIETLCCKH